MIASMKPYRPAVPEIDLVKSVLINVMELKMNRPRLRTAKGGSKFTINES